MRFQLLVLLLLASSVSAQDMALRDFEKEGLAAFRAGDFATCAKVFASATPMYPHEPSPAFVGARCYGRLGEMALARKFLEEALDRGYRNCTNIAGEASLRAFPKLVARCESNAEAFVRNSNPELLAAYLGDRADRSATSIDVEGTLARDEARRRVVRIAIEHHLLHTADDYLHAALVMHHGSKPEEFALARDLAKTAATKRPWLAEARWLYAAATDRYLQSIAKPQIFGTQYSQVNGRWTLEPFDANAVTDAERFRWRVAPAAERQRLMDELNAQSDQ